MKTATIPVAALDDAALAGRLREEGLRLTPGEARRVAELIGHDPTRVEAVLFDTLWSEHCSYKSSRAVLKAFLPTEAPHVILGPGEDAGVVYFTTHAGERWALVVAHESHNHPSQVVPAEGAATGIGGVVRDVYCMGADVIGVLDGLRFGSLSGPNEERSREIARGVVDGIWHYANALGVPNLGGDVAFDARYDENCLVNVVAVGVVRERELVRSRVPREAREVPYVFVLVGKPTDASGFGGASFASAVLDETEAEANKGAVQLPDPFLKRVLTEATKEVLRLARDEGFAIGFKDLGAGGIACATSELAAAGGFGADIDLAAVSLDGDGFPPEVISCSETQERYCLVVPAARADAVLRIFNEDFELPGLYPGARAQVIGTVRTGDTLYRVRHGGDLVAEATVEAITEGIRYDRPVASDPSPVPESAPSEPEDLAEVLRALLHSAAIGSREGIYRHYDTEVQGRAVIRPGEADASLSLPIAGCAAALAVSLDGNPFHGALDPYQGGAGAVAESMRNVAAVGARPWCLTDCLNYGNPEDPEAFRQFREGVRGLGDAARRIGLPGEPGAPLPVVSGNVSFYNQSSTGRSIPPSPIVVCYGVLSDYSRAVTPALRDSGERMFLIGRRRRELGGSAYWRHLGVAGGAPPAIDFAAVRAEIEFVLAEIETGVIGSCHDVSEGGIAVAAAEMALLSRHGIRLEIAAALGGLRVDEALFTETGGFLAAVSEEDADGFARRAAAAGVEAFAVGETTRGRVLEVNRDGDTLIRLAMDDIEGGWQHAVEEAMA